MHSVPTYIEPRWLFVRQLSGIFTTHRFSLTSRTRGWMRNSRKTFFSDQPQMPSVSFHIMESPSHLRLVDLAASERDRGQVEDGRGQQPREAHEQRHRQREF